MRRLKPWVGVGEVGPAQCRNLELRFLGGSVARSRALDGAVGNLERGFVVARAQREGDLQQDVFFVPVGLHVYVDTRRAWVKRDVLSEGGTLPRVLDANDSPQPGVFDELHFVSLQDVSVVLDKIGVHVPCVPLLRLVNEGLQQVAAGFAVGEGGGRADAWNGGGEGVGLLRLSTG